MPAQPFVFGIVVDAYGGVHDRTAGADGTLPPAELERLRAAQLDAQRRPRVAYYERCEVWWRERDA